MKAVSVFSALIWLLVLVATATSILDRAPEPRIEIPTVRGEYAIYQGSGLYRYDPASVAREGLVWDAINLSIGLPLFAAAIVLRNRGSLRGRLLLGGLLFYFFYVYLMYATMVAFNRLFPVYVAIFGLSLVAFVTNLQEIDVSRLPAQLAARFPRRLFIGFTFALSAALILLWSRLIVSIMIAGRFPPELAGVTTLETQALDLGLVVPLALSTGILLWRRSPWGYLLTGITTTFGLMMCITIPAWIAVPLIQEGKIKLAEAPPFLVLSVVGLYLVWAFYSNVQERQSAGSNSSLTPGASRPSSSGL